MSHQPLRVVPHVDHRDPIHDATCRCPVCKPSLNQHERDGAMLTAIIVFCCPVAAILGGIAWASLHLAGKL